MRKQIQDKELREEVSRVVEELGHVPTMSEFNEMGSYTASTVARRFGDGSWIEALESLGYSKSSKYASIPAEKLEADVRRVVDLLGYPPNTEEYNEHGEYSSPTVANRLGDGTWRPALESLGYERVGTPTAVYHIDSDDLVRDVKRVADEMGRAPTYQEYDEHGHYTPATVAKRFGDGRWPDALGELGFDMRAYVGGTVSDDILHSDVDRIADEIGGVPTMGDYRKHGRYSARTVAERFGDGNWAAALRTLGYNFWPGGGSGPLRDLLEVALELGHPPSRDEYEEHGAFPLQVVANRVGDGTWTGTLKELREATSRADIWENVSTMTPREEIRQEFLALTRKLGRPASEEEYRAAGSYDPETVLAEFDVDTWANAIVAIASDTSLLKGTLG
jgi:hypothetical protein